MLAAATISCSAMMPAKSVTPGHERRRRCAPLSLGRGRTTVLLAANALASRSGQTAIATICRRADTWFGRVSHLSVDRWLRRRPVDRLKKKCGDSHEKQTSDGRIGGRDD